MIEVSINSIRAGVANALGAAFPDVTIYDEEIPQGFVSPSFFIKLLTAAQEKELYRRYNRAHAFDIHFFPAGPYYNEQAHSMAEKLYEVLENVDIDGAVYRGTGMNHEVVDRTLHFFVDLNFLVWKQKPDTPKMTTLDQEGYLKHG